MSEKLPESSSDSPVDDFGSMLAAFEREQGGGTNGHKKRRGPRPGDTVRGKVISIGADTAFVDLGGKAEGSLSLADLRDPEGRVTISVGEEIDARVVSFEEGQAVLRRSLGHGKQAHAELQQAFELGLPVDGLVTGVNKGGVEVQVAGARAFCPISQLEARHVEDATSFVGQRLQFRITRYEAGQRGRENIVLSRRALLEEEQRARAVETVKKITVGAVLEGKVTTIKDYGAFVDLGGVEGMLHISEIAFARTGHPKDVLSVGQTLTVQILKIEKAEKAARSDDARRHDKISLSLKSLEKDPWTDASERFPEGSTIAGIVARVETFGAFVEIAPGVEGLVHVSEMGGGGSSQPRNLVRPGQSVQVRVIAVDRDKKRVSLSMEAAPETMDDMPEAGRAPAKSFGTLGDLLKGSGGKNRKK